MNNVVDFLSSGQTIGAYVMLILAIRISVATTVHQRVNLYRWQTVILVVVMVLASLRPWDPWILALAILPTGLALFVPRLLHRATVLTPSDSGADALLWQQLGAPHWPRTWTLAMDAALFGLAMAVAYRVIQSPGVSAPGTAILPAAIGLLLLGLFAMVNCDDILSQVVGLLVLDHGLFLSVVKISAWSQAIVVYFVLGLFFYVVVTLVILGHFLPALYQTARSIAIDDWYELKG